MKELSMLTFADDLKAALAEFSAEEEDYDEEEQDD